MSIEELMKPRWKVVTDYPQSLFFINEIVFYDGLWAKTDEVKVMVNPDSYPAIFKKLQWWEERKEEDLPKYLYHTQDNKIIKIIRIEVSGIVHITSTITSTIKYYLPSTKEEYYEQQKHIS